MSSSRPIEAYAGGKSAGEIGIKEAAEANDSMRGIKSKLKCLFGCAEYDV